jgi:hypothetical protein
MLFGRPTWRSNDRSCTAKAGAYQVRVSESNDHGQPFQNERSLNTVENIQCTERKGGISHREGDMGNL